MKRNRKRKSQARGGRGERRAPPVKACGGRTLPGRIPGGRAPFARSGRRLLDALLANGLISPRWRKDLGAALDRAVRARADGAALSFSASLNAKLSRLLAGSSATGKDKLSRQMSTLDSVSKVVLACTREDRVLEKCLTLLRELVPFQNGAVFVVREDTGRLELEATLGYPQDLIERVQFDLGQGLSAWAAREKRAVLVKELSRPEKDGMPPLGSFLAVPIVAGGRSVGVITMGHPQPGAFVGDHKRTLQLFCTLISGSVLAMLLERRRSVAGPAAAATSTAA
ncbi:MAG: GAF domain-containing protein [Candidatus Eisenbacteria bacterium]|nr:GAF domain-containing protein [Candidatus Eisenbacteria bacterium]